jgi:GAF domain-containing protein
MPDKEITELGSLVSTMEDGGVAPNSDSLAKVAQILAHLFGVDADEVAILKFMPKFKSLKFVIPEKFALVGTIPLTSTTALASRTARERKPELVNNFTAARHANVFEAVPLGRDPSQLIQKIMSAPILDGTRVHGVVQISRKAVSLSQAGADFTQKDLRTLVGLSPVLDRFLKLCKVE